MSEQSSALFLSTTVNALLIDENEEGYYLTLKPEGRAIFVPRNGVASVYFGPQEELVGENAKQPHK
jgi:hypothetical protein